MTVITHPSYDQLHNACVTIAYTILKLNPVKFDNIIGLVRGGTFPAMILSHLLDVPMIAVHYSSKSGAGDNKNHSNELPTIHGKTILLVDDIADSGKTLTEVCRHYITNKCNVYTAVLYYKEQPRGIEPDYYWQKIPTDAPWVIMPWEQN